ncbi:MAG TPA: cytochrome P450 [Novosphingobium sp.]|nr:cytochrome P450 [Novosphingobium sp.]
METSTIAPDLLDAGTFADGPPHAVFDILREVAPAYGQPNPVNGGTAWSLTRHADIRAVSSDCARFTSSLGVQYPTPDEEVALRAENLVWHDPPRHARQRSFAAKAFSPRVVARFEEWIRGLCVKIVDEIEERQAFDAIPVIAAELPGQVICTIMGVPEPDRTQVIAWATQFFGRLDPAIGFEGSAQGFQNTRDYLNELGGIKRREPGVDMVTELLGAEHEGVPITPSEFTELAATLVNAGFETTHTLFAQSLVMMARDGDVRQQVEGASREALGPVVDELLRHTSPIMHMMRTAKEDVELHGKTIGKGDKVLLWYTAGNRDPRVFEDPHRFDGARKRRNHLAFGGGGPHFCLGNHLARLEGEILFDEMNKRGVRLELDGEPRRAQGMFVNALRALPMRVVPR